MPKHNVEAATVYVSNITLNKTSASLYIGETTQLYADVSPSSATNKSVSWTSDDTSVATVSNSGKVTAKSAGTAIITCKAMDGSGEKATCIISVKEDGLPTSVHLNFYELSLTKGELFRLHATVYPLDAVDNTVTWMSDNTAVATVDNEGVVTAKGVGVANIIVKTTNNLVAVCAVTVDEKNIIGPTVWTGKYKVTGNCVELEPTREYPNVFEMTIAEKDGSYYVTSMFGEDLTKYNGEGFKLHDNEDGTASINSLSNNILKCTDYSSPLYALYVYDEVADEWADTWTLKRNENGTLDVGKFYVVSFTWDEAEKTWKNEQKEACYSAMTAENENVTGISETRGDLLDIHIEQGTVWLDEAAYVTVYKDNGMKVCSGNTNRIENLSKGVYIVRIGNQSAKIQIK